MWKPAGVAGMNYNSGIVTDPFCCAFWRIPAVTSNNKTMLNFLPTFWQCNDSLHYVVLLGHNFLLKCKNFASIPVTRSLHMCILSDLQAKKHPVIFYISSREHTPTHKCSLLPTLLLAYLSACSMIGFENIGCKVSSGKGKEIIHH